MNRARTPLLGLAVALLGGTAMATETPKFEVVKAYDDFEVRQYGAAVVAETVVEGPRADAGNAAFSRLAAYIFGKNRSDSSIAMTSPVTQAEMKGQQIEMTAPVTQTATGKERWTVQFTMPAALTLETLPAPNDPLVTLRAIAPRKVATLKYSGTWSQSNYDEHLATLVKGVAREGLVTKGAPTWARYDPPWTPWFLRTNEIQLEVE